MTGERPIADTHAFACCVCCHCADSASTIISSGDLQSFSETASVGLHDDAVLTELKKLAKDLAAIRRQMDSRFQESKSSEEWKLISSIIDRLIFGLYIVFICVSVVIILIVGYCSRYSSL